MNIHQNISENCRKKQRLARERFARIISPNIFYPINRILTLMITVSLCAMDLLLYFGGNQIESMSSMQYL